MKPFEEEFLKEQKIDDKKKQPQKKMTKKDRPKLIEGSEVRCIDGM
ncbi:unnamed protein product [Anisakis simplex]|uniref:Thymosin beta n=1 Tax=Anisakis simplex TaxID=6269 RepID=A0A0M3JNK2_ANISI|nr:unnamed protein product [Anisakis simplex]